MLPFLLIHIVDSTFHPADCRGRLQTIRQFRRSDFRRSTQACFPLFIHSGINYPPTYVGPLTADRPTMHRKFWRISNFKELWAMKRILSLHSRKELRFASFPFLSFGILAFYKNAIRRIRLQIGFANLLLQPLTSNLLPFFYAPSRESVQDSCRPVKPCRASHRLKNGVAIFADSKRSLLPLSSLSREGNLLHAPPLYSFRILTFFTREHSALHKISKNDFP